MVGKLVSDSHRQCQSDPLKNPKPEMTMITGGGGDPDAVLASSSQPPFENSDIDEGQKSTPRPEINPQSVTYTFEQLNNNGESCPPPCPQRQPISRPGSAKKGDNRGISMRWICPFYHIHNLLCVSFMILIIFQATIIGFWIRLFDLINTSMPQTFSWLSILSSYGSIFSYNKCAVDLQGQGCDLDHTVPYISIMAMNLSSIQLIMTLLFLFFKSCRKPFLFYLKQMVFLHGLFLIFGGVAAGAFLYRDLSNLRNLMRREMISSNLNESGRWKRTQILNECCGVDNFTDWIFDQNQKIQRMDVIPKSCCVSSSCDKTESNALQYFDKGCYNVEYDTVVYYGKIEIMMILSGFVISIAVLLLSKRYYLSCKKNKKNLDEATSHQIFIRQGSNYTVFGGQSGDGSKTHIIRKNGILIETKGVLASSTSLNDDELSLEILNFSRNDTINVSRESDRIVITVVKNNYFRGKAILTAINDRNLEKIKITPTSTGVLHITI